MTPQIRCKCHMSCFHYFQKKKNYLSVPWEVIMNVLPNLVISSTKDKTGFSPKRNYIYLNTWVASKCSESNFSEGIIFLDVQMK